MRQTATWADAMQLVKHAPVQVQMTATPAKPTQLFRDRLLRSVIVILGSPRIQTQACARFQDVTMRVQPVMDLRIRSVHLVEVGRLCPGLGRIRVYAFQGFIRLRILLTAFRVTIRVYLAQAQCQSSVARAIRERSYLESLPRLANARMD
jgi:hypothetical protein